MSRCFSRSSGLLKRPLRLRKSGEQRGVRDSAKSGSSWRPSPSEWVPRTTSRQELMRTGWSCDYDEASRTLDVHIYRSRLKTEYRHRDPSRSQPRTGLQGRHSIDNSEVLMLRILGRANSFN